MPPIVAAIICIVFILFAFWWDRKASVGLSSALWIPQIWMILVGSRYAGQWIAMFFGGGGGVSRYDAYMEGSTLDASVFFFLMMAGTIVLIRRNLNWGQVLLQNWWIVLYFLFGALSILWSDYPDVSAKRLFKATGNVIMAMVILTEAFPLQAMSVLFRRMGILLLPLSLLFIKYYPAWGRAYHVSGQLMVTGVTTQKNSLGALCFLCGMYFIASLIPSLRGSMEKTGRTSMYLNLIFVALSIYLLNMADSATSLACLGLAGGILIVSRMSFFVKRPRRIMVYGSAAVCLYGFLEAAFDFSNVIIALLGRNPSLTTRVPMWEGLIARAENPLIGVGYESFWLGPRLLELWGDYGRLNQAHNGYIETYLNLGWIGVVIFVCGILAGLIKVWRHLPTDYSAAVWRLTFIVVVSLYNYTEATFHGINNLWLMLLLGIVEVSVRKAAEQPARKYRTAFGDMQPVRTPLQRQAGKASLA